MNYYTGENERIRPFKCPDCKIAMERIETYDCVEVSYSWNENTKTYEEIDQDFCGNTEIRYNCIQCGKEIVD